MRNPPSSLIELVERLIDELERSDIEYAIGGAVAYGTWAEPRATQDVDINVWAKSAELGEVFALLEQVGAAVDRVVAEKEATDRGMFVARAGNYRIDVFVPSVPFYEEARRRRRRVAVVARDTWVLSPETLAVFKMLFFRPKDLVDIRRLLEVQGEGFDRDFVRHWLVEMVGEQDERIREWDRMP